MKKKQCKSASPGLGWRCEKKRGHTGFHRCEWVEWGPTEGSTWMGLQAEMGLASKRLGLAEHAEEELGHEAAPIEAANELGDWWRGKAEAEIEQTVAKAIEYGSTDLIDIGRSLARVAGRESVIHDEAEAAEWGIFFYLEGKLSRWRSAIERGERPSADTLLDIGVYVRMAQRIRDTGGWPGTPMPQAAVDESQVIFHSMCTIDSPGYNKDARLCCAYHNAKDQEQ